MSIEPFTDRPLEINCDFELVTTAPVALDLLQLAPEKFRSSQILIDYLGEASIQIGNWLTKIRDTEKLLNSRTVSSVDYLIQLGALLGVTFPPADSTSESEMRKTLYQAIDWYKVKGTYHAAAIVSLIQQFSVNIYDMYTNDYTNFEMVDWFVGEEGENPPGFDASYYKSPHFGLEMLLNRKFLYESTWYLWQENYLDNLFDRMEQVRPVHTVPHFVLFLNPQADEFGNLIEVDGGIQSISFGEWEQGTLHFDEIDSGGNWYFDDGGHFDSTSIDFFKSITKWVLGTGNNPPDWGDFNIETPVLTGSISTDDIIITEDYITFEFTIPKLTTSGGLSELGLYIPGVPDTLVLGSCFPKIDKDSRTELRIQIKVYRNEQVPEEEDDMSYYGVGFYGMGLYIGT